MTPEEVEKLKAAGLVKPREEYRKSFEKGTQNILKRAGAREVKSPILANVLGPVTTFRNAKKGIKPTVRMPSSKKVDCLDLYMPVEKKKIIKN